MTGNVLVLELSCGPTDVHCPTILHNARNTPSIKTEQRQRRKARRETWCGSDTSSMISLSHTSLTVFTWCHGGYQEFRREARAGSERTGNWTRAFFPLGLSFSICKTRGCTRSGKWLACITQVSPSSPAVDTTHGLQHCFTWSTDTQRWAPQVGPVGCQGCHSERAH